MHGAARYSRRRPRTSMRSAPKRLHPRTRASIYRDLHYAVRNSDGHASKILEQKKVLMALATEWCSLGQLSESDRDEIIAVVTMAPFQEWRPLLLIIPHAGVADRVQRVPRGKRAGSEPEYILPDLKRHEFDIVELKL